MNKVPAPSVEYGISVDLRRPAASVALDDAQREQAASVLGGLLEQVEGADGPDGAVVLVDSTWTAVHPEGALILLVVHAPSLDVAEAGVHDILIEVLARNEVLSGWTVARCQVGFDQRFVEAGLRAADGPGAPPDDPAERVRRSARQPRADVADVDEDEAAWRSRVAGYASSVRAFGPAAFGAGADGDGDQSAALAAGALVAASTMFIDEQIEDITTLARLGGTVGSSPEMFLALGELPSLFAHCYDGRFARKFLVSTIMVTGRLSAPQWEQPACVAEALALHLIVKRAGDLLIDHGWLNQDDAEDLYAEIDDATLEDTDIECLYAEGPDKSSGDAARHRDVDAASWTWFEPISQRAVHPFTIDAHAALGA